MELLNLVASLTLDTTQYQKDLDALLKDPQPSTPDIKVAPVWDEQAYKKFIEDGLKDGSIIDLTGTTPTSIPAVDTKEYKQSLKDAEEETNWFKEVMKGAWQGIKDAIVVTGITGVVSGIVNYLRQGINLAIKDGKAIEAGAKNLQLSIRAYQEWDYVLGKSNMSVKDLNKAMTEMDSIRAGSASKEKLEYLTKIGVNAEDATSGLMSAEQLLDSVMKGLANYEGTDKGAIIDAFFGKGANWTGYFSQTSAEIEGLKQEAESLGVIMSDESVKNAKEFQDAIDRLNDRLESIKRSFGEGILPIITEAVNKLMMIVDFFNGQDKRTSSEKFVDLEDKFQAQLADIKATGITAKTLAQTLLNMGDTSTMDSTQLAIWKGTAESLINLIPTLSGVIDTENGTISESTEGIERLIDQYTELSKATAYQTSKAERQAILDQKENELIEKSAKVNNDLAEAEGNRTKAIDDFNAVIEKYGKYYGGVEGIGYNATLEDVQAAKERLLNAMFGDEQNMGIASKELSEAIMPLSSMLGQAANAQADIEKLSNDIDQGTADLEEWVATQGATYEAISGTAGSAVEDVNKVTEALNGIPSDVTSTIHIITDGESDGIPQAKGNWSVPYDNYPSLLHRGEMVLTKSQARQYREGGGNDSSAVVAAIQSMRNDLQNMKLIVGQRVFGRTVVDYGGNRMNDYIGEADSRAASGYGA